MKNIARIIIGIIIIGLIAVSSFLAYIWFAGGSGDVSQDIADASETLDGVASGFLFRINAEESEASFTLEEDLAGVRTTVIGSTNQVGGDIILNMDNPQASQLGTIRINARSFATDQEMRNRSIRSNILLSSQDEYEFIDLVPTGTTGLPDSVEIGGTYSFEVTGDLTIIGQTNPVTFSVSVTVESDTRITGSATANILYADWGITIRAPRHVANITDDVDLAINFVANAVTEE